MLTLDVRRAFRMLAALGGYLGSREPLELAGMRSLEESQQAFQTESDPVTGRGWARLKPATTKAKGSSTILYEYGDLQGSFRLGAPSNLFRFAGKRKLLVGSKDPKAPFHQTGTRYIPARRMSGMSTSALAAVMKAIIAQAIREMRRA